MGDSPVRSMCRKVGTSCNGRKFQYTCFYHPRIAFKPHSSLPKCIRPEITWNSQPPKDRRQFVDGGRLPVTWWRTRSCMWLPPFVPSLLSKEARWCDTSRNKKSYKLYTRRWRWPTMKHYLTNKSQFHLLLLPPVLPFTYSRSFWYPPSLLRWYELHIRWALSMLIWLDRHHPISYLFSYIHYHFIFSLLSL